MRLTPIDTPRNPLLRLMSRLLRRRLGTTLTFATLRQHFEEREIVAITWLNAVENYFNLLTVPLGIGADGAVRDRGGSDATDATGGLTAVFLTAAAPA